MTDIHNILSKFNDLGILNEGLTAEEPKQANEMNKGGKHSDETLAKMSGDNHHSAWKKDKTTDEYKKRRKQERVAFYKKKKEEDLNEGEFEITYKDPQFKGTRTHTIKAVNAKGAEQKFLSFGNPHKILDVKKKEKVNEADAPLPQDFVPEPVVAQTIKDLGPGLDPMGNSFYDLAYGKLLGNYLAKETPEIKKKFNVNWNLAWASQMRELYSREYGGYMKTPVKEEESDWKGSDELNSGQPKYDNDMYEESDWKGSDELNSGQPKYDNPMYEAHDKLEKLVGQKVYVKNKGQTGKVSMVSPTHSNALVVDMDNGQTTVSHFKDLTSEGDKPGTLKRYLDMLKDVVDAHDRGAVPKGGYAGKDDYTMNEESYTDSEVQRAVRIANHMKGDMTDATDAIEALKKGLTNHPKVKAALRNANESINESTNNVSAMMKILSGIN